MPPLSLSLYGRGVGQVKPFPPHARAQPRPWLLGSPWWGVSPPRLGVTRKAKSSPTDGCNTTKARARVGADSVKGLGARQKRAVSLRFIEQVLFAYWWKETELRLKHPRILIGLTGELKRS